MMKTKTKTVIRIETHETIVIRSASRFPFVWCATCGIEARVLTPDQAATVTQTAPREIYRRIEGGLLHAIETNDGATLICCNEGLKQSTADWDTEQMR